MPFSLPSSIPLHTFKVMQTDIRTSWHTTSTGGEINSALVFEANQIDNFNNFSSIFDQYRVDLLEVWIVPQLPVVTQSANRGGVSISVVDFTDGNTATVAVLQEYESALVSHTGSGHYRRFTPHVNVTAYAGGSAEFINVTAPWVDCAFPDVEFHAVKFSTTATSGAAVPYDLFLRAHISFRQVR
jgi:hypothetical protein